MKLTKLNIVIMSSVLVSIVLGMLLQDNQALAKQFIPLGTIYVNLIKMLMIPLVVSSLVVGISGMSNVKRLGKVGLMTIIAFLSTTAISVIIGLFLSNVFMPGTGVAVIHGSANIKDFPGVINTIVNIFPVNMINSFAQGNMLQSILIAIVIGVGLVDISPKGGYLRNIFDEMFTLMCRITVYVMWLTPIGIIGLLVPVVAINGSNVIMPLIKLVAVFFVGVVLMELIYAVLVAYLTDYNISYFTKAVFPAQIIAFFTCSSAAALPVLIQRVREKLSISEDVSGLVLPLGNTVNMDGNALYQGIVALFISQAYGLELTIYAQITVVLTGTVASIGAAGVPGAGMIVLGMVLSSVGLPLEGIALVAGVDRILDMGRTLLNVTSDCVVAAIVDKMIQK